MQARVQILLLIAGLGLASVPAAIAAPFGGRAGADAAGLATLVAPVQYWGVSYCERLRRACVYKEFRDEVGEGNCRRYRRTCLHGRSYCERLRLACIYKGELDEVGEGNCRRYRYRCGRYGGYRDRDDD